MKYDNKVVTKDGITLMTQSISDKAEPVMDKMLVLNTDIPNGKSLEEMSLSDFSNAISFDVNNVSQNDTSFTASAVISNNGINQDYSAKLIGISGYLSNSDNRKLFAVAQASEPFVITRQAETPLTLVPSITIGFSNSQNVQLTVKNDVYVTQADLDDLKKQISENIGGPDSIVSKNIETMGKQANDYTDTKVNNLDSETSQGISNLGKLMQPLLDVDEIKKDVNNRFGDYQKGLDGKQDNVDLSVKDNKLYYAGTPVLTATTPNQPKISVKLNGDTGNLAYQITPPDLDGGASITNYVISYRIITDENWKTLQVNGTTFNGEIAGIQKGQTYQVKVTATNMAGKSVDSETQQVLAASEPRGVNIDVNVTNIFPNEVNYNISFENNGGLNDSYYQIFYKKDTDTNWQLINNAKKQDILPQLKENGNYQIKAKVGNLVGISNESQIKTFNCYVTDYPFFNQRTAFLGSTPTTFTSHENTIITSNPPNFTAPFSLKNKDIKIEFNGGQYYYYNDGWDPSTSTSQRSILNPTIIIKKEELANGGFLDIVPKLNIANISNCPANLYVRLDRDNMISFYNYQHLNTDMNYDTGGYDTHFVVPVLNKISVM